MPTFIDRHSAKNTSHDELVKMANHPADKNGVTYQELFFDGKGEAVYCITRAPDAQSVIKYHDGIGAKCDFVTEVTHIMTEKSIKNEKLAVLGQMSSNISHDLRNPMSVIKNSIDLISTKYNGQLVPGITGQLAMMDRAVLNMNSMINDILNFARTQALYLEDHSLSKIIGRSISSIKVPQNIKITLSQSDITMRVDGTKLESAFYNIIVNAIQSIGDSSGEITVTIAEEPEGNAMIRIQNSGPAIPDDILDKIFEPLFTTKKRGTGLGLPSCKNIVEQHHGTIRASNNPTAFTIILPRNFEKPSPTK